MQLDDLVLGKTKGMKYKGDKVEGICRGAFLLLQLRMRREEQLTPSQVGI